MPALRDVVYACCSVSMVVYTLGLACSGEAQVHVPVPIPYTRSCIGSKNRLAYWIEEHTAAGCRHTAIAVRTRAVDQEGAW
jgi:hypothetical protein